MARLETLIDTDTLRARVAEIAAEIDRDYAGRKPILVGILKGSVHFLSDLARQIQLETTLDFMRVSSYGNAQVTSGIIRIGKDLDASIEDQDVILVEDIVDTGLTLHHLHDLLRTRKPKSLATVALLSKKASRKVEVPVEYIGFEIPDEFVVGYGLDYAERYRNLPAIVVLHES
ncbi:MAG: hypoxanthine phosphoribosyltransferase [Fimbriimonas sp.]